MSRNRLIVAAVLVAVLAAYQVAVMEGLPEKREEDRFTHIADIPIASKVPTYLGSLFLGSFRAVVVDVFWIELKNLRDEKRFFEAQQTMELISWLQPRNPEVWSMLAWDATYNIPEGGITDADERWSWIRYGLLKLHEGASRNPLNPYLKYELGRVLWHKHSWKGNGWFDLDLINRIKQDDELQRKLQGIAPGKAIGERQSPFQLAVRWFRMSRVLVEQTSDRDRYYFTTQMGLNLHPSSIDGFIRECLYLEGMYRWRMADFDGARKMMAAAIAHIKESIERHGKLLAPADRTVLTLVEKLPPVIDLYARALEPGISPEEKNKLAIELARKMEAALTETGGPLDGGYVQSHLVPLKISLAEQLQGSRDTLEFNDGRGFARPIREGNAVFANIGPFLTDVDTYSVFIPAPRADENGRRGEKPNAPPFIERDVTLVLSPKQKLPLKLSVQYYGAKPVKEEVVPAGERVEITFHVSNPGAYYVSISAPEPSPDFAPPSRYFFQWLETNPPLGEKPGPAPGGTPMPPPDADEKK